ncbi:MAG: CehA/McbA family metallohydrolase, partial [Candidatus Dormibacteraceae bacterium]
LGQISYAYIDGTCQGWLPRGEVIVDLARGFEYDPLRARVTIEPGQRELTLRLKRWTNLNAQRWFSGDTHVHFLSTQGSHLEARGEDLNVVNLLLSQWGHLFTNTEEFTGRPTVSPDGQTIVYATQENRQHFLGHLTLLGLKEAVMPWCSDGPSEAEMGGTLEITMSDWADQCHRQGGTVILPHLPNPNGEPAAMIATGRVDGVEMIQFARYNHLEYYRYLNGGYRLPLVGGTDKMTSDVPVGLYRTYVYIPPDEEFTYANWCKNLSAGRTFLSGGPIISFTVDGHRIGDTVKLPGNGGTVEVEASAESIFPIHTLQVIREGKVAASAESATGTRRLSVKTKLKVERDTWLAARAGGPGYDRAVPHHDCWSRGILAHTSPIYVACGGEWRMFDQGTASYMLTLIDGSLTYMREISPRYAPGTVTHHHGEADHQAYLERPFLEAREAIHRRLHELGMNH